MSDRSLVSVIVPVYNQRPWVRKNLMSWLSQECSLGEYELLIVDDGSTDGLELELRAVSGGKGVWFNYVRQEHRGPAAARNFGVRQARGSFVAFTDADCHLDKRWLEEISQGYGDDRVVGIGGAVKAYPTQAVVSRYCAQIRLAEEPVRDHENILYVITASASFRKSALLDIGGFDERIGWAGGEEIDLCHRLRQRGGRLRFNPRAAAYNSHKQTVAALMCSFFNYGQGDAYVMLKRARTAKDGCLVSHNQTEHYLQKRLGWLGWIGLSVKAIFRWPINVRRFRQKGFKLKISLQYAIFQTVQEVAFYMGCCCGYFRFRYLKEGYGYKENNKE